MTTAGAIRHPLWTALRERAEPASVSELAQAVGTTDASIAWRLSRWSAAGLLRTVKGDNDDHAGGGRTRYVMADASRSLPAPPPLNASGQQVRTRGGRAAMWRAIRVLKRFDLVQLTMTAEVTETSARQFVSCLLRAGIVWRISRGHAATGQRSVYSLAGMFGPQPPVVRISVEDGKRVQDVVDPNTGHSWRISAQRPVDPLF